MAAHIPPKKSAVADVFVIHNLSPGIPQDVLNAHLCSAGVSPLAVVPHDGLATSATVFLAPQDTRSLVNLLRSVDRRDFGPEPHRSIVDVISVDVGSVGRFWVGETCRGGEKEEKQSVDEEQRVVGGAYSGRKRLRSDECKNGYEESDVTLKACLVSATEAKALGERDRDTRSDGGGEGKRERVADDQAPRAEPLDSNNECSVAVREVSMPRSGAGLSAEYVRGLERGLTESPVVAKRLAERGVTHVVVGQPLANSSLPPTFATIGGGNYVDQNGASIPGSSAGGTASLRGIKVEDAMFKFEQSRSETLSEMSDIDKRNYLRLVDEVKNLYDSKMSHGQWHAFLIVGLPFVQPRLSQNDGKDKIEFSLRKRLNEAYPGIRISHVRFLDFLCTNAIILVEDRESLAIALGEGSSRILEVENRVSRLTEFAGSELTFRVKENMREKQNMIDDVLVLASRRNSQAVVCGMNSQFGTFTIRGDPFNLLMAASLNGRFGRGQTKFHITLIYQRPQTRLNSSRRS